jgi:hypothetical protein
MHYLHSEVSHEMKKCIAGTQARPPANSPAALAATCDAGKGERTPGRRESIGENNGASRGSATQIYRGKRTDTETISRFRN